MRRFVAVMYPSVTESPDEKVLPSSFTLSHFFFLSFYFSSALTLCVCGRENKLSTTSDNHSPLSQALKGLLNQNYNHISETMTVECLIDISWESS